MAVSTFRRLTCERTQDGFGADEAFMAVFVDGGYVGNVYRQLSVGQTLDLGFSLDFEDEIRVQLWEVDNPAAGNPHDFLGEARIGVNDPATSAVFDQAGGLYRLEFAVAPSEQPAPQPVPQPVPQPEPLALRRNQATMTGTERQRFLDALQTLIENGTFGRFVQDHAGPAGDFAFRNHFFAAPFGEMRFLAWHRSYLFNLERELRAVDPSVFIPYWRWTIDRGIPDWLDNFTPPVPMPVGGDRDVVRGLPQAASLLPTTDTVNTELSNQTFASFTRAIERGSHGAVHMWIGGNMGNTVIASSDVLFWLHHCEIDRLWNAWQRTHNEGPTLAGNERIMDPYAETVDDVMDVETLGYTYA